MHSKNIDEVLRSVSSSYDGISNIEAKKRLEQNGKNELEKPRKLSFIKCFLKQFLNIMVAILLVSAAVSIILAISNHNYADLLEGFVILFIVFMNAIIGVFQEYRAQACVDELQKYNQINVKVLRNGGWISLDSSMLVCGDIVEIEAGNVVMADIRLISANNLACDESSLTGESEPVKKITCIELEEKTPLADRVNMVYSGSMVTSGKGTGVVIATGKLTEIGKIATLLNNSKKEITPLQKSISKIGKIITWIVLAVVFIVLSIEIISGHSVIDAMMISVSLAVAAIPESLPAVITLIMALGVQQLAKNKCIIKRLHAVETLGSCEIICTDKTGTLTQNKMQVVESYSGLIKCGNLNDMDYDMRKCITLCNSSKIINNSINGEPTERALLEYVYNKDMIREDIIHEIPFDSSRKMMTVITNENGIVSYTKGAPEIILKKCKYVKIDGKIQEINANIMQKIENINNFMADKAYRVIGFAMKKLDKFSASDNFEDDMIFLGLIGLMDNPKAEVKQSIEKCFDAGLVPIMITGDHKRTAFAIAKQLGIASQESQVITGEDLDKLTDKELKKRCGDFRVYARVTSEHKVRIVKAYKKLNKIVAMTGDGVNDAPSLKIADIGVGMGKTGTDVVKSVADMLVLDDNFSSIVVAVEQGRKVYSNIQKALQFLISTNCVEVFGMLISLLFFPKYVFLTAAQMLFINLVTDSLPAFALGVENVEEHIMKSPPRNSRAGLFSGVVGYAIIYQSILQTTIALAVFLIGVYCYSPEVASTMVFFTIIFMQLLHSINCKTNDSIFSKKLTDNKVFNLCFIITLMLNLMVACVPFMYKVFGLQLLNLSQWVMVGISSVLIIPACELMKAIKIPKSIKIKQCKKILKNIKNDKN